MGWFRLTPLGAALLLPLAVIEPVTAVPRHVLLLHSYVPHFSPWRAIAGRFREEFIVQSPYASIRPRSKMNAQDSHWTKDRSWITCMIFFPGAASIWWWQCALPWLARTAEAGALSASFSHGLSQPLASIMLSAETAEWLLRAEPPDVGLLREMLGDIREADQHASEIISHVKNHLERRSEVETQGFDLNEAISHAMQVPAPEATKRNVALRVTSIQQPLPVRADRIHLQQVLLNLAEWYGRDGRSTFRRSQDDHSNSVAGGSEGGVPPLLTK